MLGWLFLAVALLSPTQVRAQQLTQCVTVEMVTSPMNQNRWSLAYYVTFPDGSRVNVLYSPDLGQYSMAAFDAAGCADLSSVVLPVDIRRVKQWVRETARENPGWGLTLTPVSPH